MSAGRRGKQGCADATSCPPPDVRGVACGPSESLGPSLRHPPTPVPAHRLHTVLLGVTPDVNETGAAVELAVTTDARRAPLTLACRPTVVAVSNRGREPVERRIERRACRRQSIRPPHAHSVRRDLIDTTRAAPRSEHPPIHEHERRAEHGWLHHGERPLPRLVGGFGGECPFGRQERDQRPVSTPACERERSLRRAVRRLIFPLRGREHAHGRGTRVEQRAYELNSTSPTRVENTTRVSSPKSPRSVSSSAACVLRDASACARWARTRAFFRPRAEISSAGQKYVAT